MYSKLKITATMTVLTGLHIGAAGGYSAIGAIDSPVIRDPYSGQPMVPGSSLKGKMRTLLARAELPENKYVLPECKDDSEAICRLFGTPGDSRSNINPKTARLHFSDAFMTNVDEMLRRGGVTQDKAENFITRATSIANPRHIERVARGAKFEVNWFYSAENEKEVKEDLQNMVKACCLLEMDYLGGSGTRGYGRIAFDNFTFLPLGDQFPLDQQALNALFEDVKKYAAEHL